MTAPRFQSVNALTGEISGRPSTFMKALSEADSLVRELDDLRSLQCRIGELEATPSLADRMRAAAETIRELNARDGVPADAPMNPSYLDADASRTEIP